jgi:tRNA(Ile)-lysidine synthetase-like protein
MKKKSKKNIDLINQIAGKLNEKKLLQTNQNVLVSVSGGQDSSCLIILFLQLKKQWNLNVGLLWCNHLWQIDAFFITKHIFNICFLLNLPIYFNITIEKIFTEQTARNWRYEKFHRHYKFYSYDVILTGHTASDQIETLLFHLLRGSSPKGLCALNWIKYKIINEQYFFSKLINFKSQIKTFKIKKVNYLHFLNFSLNKANDQIIKKPILNSLIQSIFMLNTIMFLFVHDWELQKKNYKQNYKNNFLNKQIYLSLIYCFLFSYKTNFLKIRFIKQSTVILYFSSLCNFELKNIVFYKLKKNFLISFHSPLTMQPAKARCLSLKKHTIQLNQQKIYLDKIQTNFKKLNFDSHPSNIYNFRIAINFRNQLIQQFQYSDVKKIFLCQYLWNINSKYEKTVFYFKSLKLKKNTFQQLKKKVKWPEKKIISKNSRLKKKNSHKIIKKFFSILLNSTNHCEHSLKAKKENKKKIIFYNIKKNKHQNKFINFHNYKNLKIICDFQKNSQYLNIFTIFSNFHIKNIFSQQLIFYSTLISDNGPRITNTLTNLYYKNSFPFKLTRIQNENFKNFYNNKNQNVDQASFYKKQIHLKKLLKNTITSKSILFYSVTQPNSLISINNKIIQIFYFKRLTQYIDFYVIELKPKLKKNFVSRLLLSSAKQEWVIPTPKSQIFRLKYRLKIVRPLVFFNRFDLKKLSQFWDLPIYPDQTNQKLKYSRNQIRKQLLPTLRLLFNPQVDYLLNQFIEILNEEQNYFEFLTIRLKNQLQKKQQSKLKINFLMLRKLPLSIQRKLLEKVLKLNFNKKITFFHIEMLLTYLENNREKKINYLPLKSYFFLPPSKKKQVKINFNKNTHYLLFQNFLSIKQINNFLPSSKSKVQLFRPTLKKLDFDPPISFFVPKIGTILIYFNKIVIFYPYPSDLISRRKRGK